MAGLRFALFGTGFWAYYQLAGWFEAGAVECVALYNRTPARAEALAKRLNISSAIYSDPEKLIAEQRGNLDFLDICTDVGTHRAFVELAAANGLPVVCQKPMAPTLADAEAMVAACNGAGVPLYINENWRWQFPLREFKRSLDRGRIGTPFRARIHYANSFPVFDNQPFLKDLEQFILTDIGSHILDTARFLFGEPQTLYGTTFRVHPDIKGEDVATVILHMQNGLTVTCEMSYASKTEIERFPQTYVYVEGNQGFLELGPDYQIRETTADGTHITHHPPKHYAWADPAYDLVHSSIVDCQANLLRALEKRGDAETTGDDNLKTVRLVFGAYASAAGAQVIRLP